MNSPGNIIELKEFSSDVYNHICLLTKQLTPAGNVPSESEFRSILNSGNTHLFVIQDDNEIPAGMLSIGIYRTPTGKKAWIEDVVIDDKFRGCGYGKKLVEHAVAFIHDLGADTISLTSNPSRVAANQLYRRAGFDRYETNVYKIPVN